MKGFSGSPSPGTSVGRVSCKRGQENGAHREHKWTIQHVVRKITFTRDSIHSFLLPTRGSWWCGREQKSSSLVDLWNGNQFLTARFDASASLKRFRRQLS